MQILSASNMYVHFVFVATINKGDTMTFPLGPYSHQNVLDYNAFQVIPRDYDHPT